MKTLDIFSNLFEHDFIREWEKRPNRHQMPLVHEIDHIQCDINKLKEFYNLFYNKSISNFEKKFVESLPGIEGNYSKRYYSGILTKITKKALTKQEEIDKIRGYGWQENQKRLSYKQKINSLKYLDKNYDPIIDERNYTILHKNAEQTYFEEFKNKFLGKISRSRFGILRPNEKIHKHIDVIPEYACRIHVPLYTNKNCAHYFIKKNKKYKFHMEEGKIYIFNGGFLHWGENCGDTDRIHLVMSVHGVEDYEKSSK